VRAGGLRLSCDRTTKDMTATVRRVRLRRGPHRARAAADSAAKARSTDRSGSKEIFKIIFNS
jgi:hypothetical protein